MGSTFGGVALTPEQADALVEVTVRIPAQIAELLAQLPVREWEVQVSAGLVMSLEDADLGGRAQAVAIDAAEQRAPDPLNRYRKMRYLGEHTAGGDERVAANAIARHRADRAVLLAGLGGNEAALRELEQSCLVREGEAQLRNR